MLQAGSWAGMGFEAPVQQRLCWLTVCSAPRRLPPCLPAESARSANQTAAGQAAAAEAAAAAVAAEGQEQALTEEEEEAAEERASWSFERQTGVRRLQPADGLC